MVVDRRDRLDADDKSLQAAHPGPLDGAAVMRGTAEMTGAAAKDFDAMTPANADVSALARGYATYLRELHAQLVQIVPLLEQLSPAGHRAVT